MSTATNFATLSPFPFCPSDISGTLTVQPHVDNLTLAQAMAFFWNLETFSISTTGTVTNGASTVNGTATVGLSPLSATGFDTAYEADTTAWFGSGFGPSLFASCPAIRQPNARVCYGASTGLLVSMEWQSSTDPNRVADVLFWLGTDPVNSGRYRIYYAFEFLFDNSSGGPTADLVWYWKSSAPFGGLSALSSGTISIGGLTLNWYSYKTTGASSTGGGMTASSTSFTY